MQHTRQHKTHKFEMDNVRIIGREDHFWKRKIKEAIEIKTHKPTLNRDSGYELAPIYDDLLTLDLSRSGDRR